MSVYKQTLQNLKLSTNRLFTICLKRENSFSNSLKQKVFNFHVGERTKFINKTIFTDDGKTFDRSDIKTQVRNNSAVFQIDSCQLEHSGRWKISASNQFGSDSIVVEVAVTGAPKSPSCPG
jgi:hypothetical protein